MILDIDKKNESIIFSWREEEFDQLLKSCNFDDGVQLSLKYLVDKKLKILEAGCGAGRVVKYLYDHGFKDVCGIEMNGDAVSFLNSRYPELNVVAGNILMMPYQKNTFDVVLSYGVVEHFPAGPEMALAALFEVVKPGGVAIITVPSFNILRRISYYISLCDFRRYNWLRKLWKKNLLKRNGFCNGLYIDPQFGNFFEYRFTKKQFEYYLNNAGFQIIESKPIAHIDGLFHSFARRFVSFKNWEFKVSKFGRLLNKLFLYVPFLHNHMHACVVKKNIKFL